MLTLILKRINNIFIPANFTFRDSFFDLYRNILIKINRFLYIFSFPCLLLFSTAFIFFSCKSEISQEGGNVFYTCSMDPQIVEKQPGNCPICKMVLTKTIVVPNNNKNSIRLSDTQLKLGNIRTTAVKINNIVTPLMLKGTVVTDPGKRAVASARISGRITRLYFKTTGIKINKGEKIFDLYSEELEAAIAQYLILKQKVENLVPGNINYKEMMLSAKDKLVVLGLTNNQIDQLKGNESNATMPFYSNREGVIEEILVHEGDYVNEGTAVLATADYATVWVAAELYGHDLKFIAPNSNIEVMVEGIVQDKRKGSVVLESPENVQSNLFSLVYINIDNKDRVIKPGMRAEVSITTGAENVISIPRTAVLTEKGKDMVWIANGEGEFTPRTAQLGKSNEELVEVLSGIKEKEMVVSSGVYLLNSEYHLRKGNVAVLESPSQKVLDQKHQH